MRWLHLINPITARVQFKEGPEQVAADAMRNALLPPWGLGGVGGGSVPPVGQPHAVESGLNPRLGPARTALQRCTHWKLETWRPGASGYTHPAKDVPPLAGQPAPHSAHGNSGKGRPFPPRISSLSSALASDPHQASQRSHHDPPSTSAPLDNPQVLSHGIARAIPPRVLPSLPSAPVNLRASLPVSPTLSGPPSPSSSWFSRRLSFRPTSNSRFSTVTCCFFDLEPCLRTRAAHL